MFQSDSLKDILFFALDKSGEQLPVKLQPDKMWFYHDEEEDLAAFELDEEIFKNHISSIDFIHPDICTNLNEIPLKKGDPIFITGSPYYLVDLEKNVIGGITINMAFDSQCSGLIRATIEKTGQAILDDESMIIHDIETVSGMSGAPSFRTIDNPDKKGPDDPFGFIEYLGILQMGTSESGFAYILDFEKIKTFFDRCIKS